MRNKIILSTLCFLAYMQSYGQSLELQVIGAAGNYQVSSSGSLSNTAGECVTNTFVNSGTILTQGFQQPLLLVAPSSVVNTVFLNNLVVNVFPVPANNLVNVTVNSDKHYTPLLLDQWGQQIHTYYQDLSTSSQTHFLFDLTPLANGTYMIVVVDANNYVVRSTQFNKIN